MNEQDDTESALATIDHDDYGEIVVAPQSGVVAKTPAQAKSDAVSGLLAKAMERASELRLTPEETKALKAEFADECFLPGAAGKDNLIYIEGAHIRDRLDGALGIGQWALVPRSRWNDEFTTGKGQPGIKVYVEAMLIVRGCYVTEAIGDMDYYPHNASTNFGDAVEGAESAALRRVAKKMGIGLQAWSKTWCAGWWRRQREGAKNQAGQQNGTQPPRPQPQQQAAPVDLRGPALAKLEAAAALGLKQMSDVWDKLSRDEKYACAPDKDRLKGKALLQGQGEKPDPTNAPGAVSGTQEVPKTAPSPTSQATDLKKLQDRIEVVAVEKGVNLHGLLPDGTPIMPIGKRLKQLSLEEATYVLRALQGLPRMRQPGEDG